MSQKELESVSVLSKSSKWSGNSKSYTAECAGCEYFKQFKEGQVCLIGIAWKFLDDSEIQDKCVAKRMPAMNQAPEEPRKYIVYKPKWIDFINGKVDFLVSLGFRAVLVDSEE